MDDAFDTVSEADRLDQDLPADPTAAAPARPTGSAVVDEAWDVPEADRFEQTQPATPADGDPGGAEAGWDVPEADRFEQAITVTFDDEDRAENEGRADYEDQELADEVVEEDPE
ncbi:MULTISPECIES: hypothetical protein [unclassified Rhodococcus (in: high G+C Gram-positive bacteria)]|uniref:hypothetical protein n=1 Tax=unclassified Rhodococcus (in: high G+C Gram-positive bacteria) TaxID=192944 RepID=UPI00289B2303|nr:MULTISPECIES: hypothetical protein [unclassified Rhodococcus (in: high G+C Gram-positive bacteria)]